MRRIALSWFWCAFVCWGLEILGNVLELNVLRNSRRRMSPVIWGIDVISSGRGRRYTHLQLHLYVSCLSTLDACRSRKGFLINAQG